MRAVRLVFWTVAACFLAQSNSSPFLWITILLVVVLIFAGVVFWLRQRLSPHEDFRGEGFTLGDLRRLHKEGKLSDAEFERAKAGMIAATHAAEKRKQEEQQNLKTWGWDTKPPE
jgi:hypothetical protein